MIDVEGLFRHLDSTRSRLVLEVMPLEADAFARPPGPSAWSTAQILDHLFLVESKLVGQFRATVEGRAPGAVRFFDRLRKLPPRLVAFRLLKAKHPEIVTPGEVRPKAELLAHLARSREDLKAFVVETRDRDLSTLRFVHFAFGALNLYEWFWFIGYHEERHRRQIADLKRQVGRVSGGPEERT